MWPNDTVYARRMIYDDKDVNGKNETKSHLLGDEAVEMQTFTNNFESL